MATAKASTARQKQVRRTARRRQQTADEIVDAAREVVLRDGVNAFSLASVAEELGLTTPAIYYYFASKEGLLAELVLRELLAVAAVVESAVADAEGGADAVERLMRAVFDRYRDRIDLFALAYRMLDVRDLRQLVGPEQLSRVRPMNDMMYAGAEARLRADQKRGLFPKGRNPRRFAFNAHMAVLGILTMKAITEPLGDPLIHGDDALIDDVCRTFREAAQRGASK